MLPIRKPCKVTVLRASIQERTQALSLLFRVTPHTDIKSKFRLFIKGFFSSLKVRLVVLQFINTNKNEGRSSAAKNSAT